MDDLVSVIVPVYNVKKYLKRCVDSVINQTYKNLEIILIDDGSTDGSGEICDEYQNKDSRIKVIHKKNGGLSSARNTGLDIKSGDYVSFVDSDDQIHSRMIEYMMNKITYTNSDMAVCEIANCETKDIIDLNCPLKISADRVYNKYGALKLFKSDSGVSMVSACNKVYKSSLFINVRYPVGRKCEDVATTYKTVFNADKIFVTDQPFYYYTYRKGSIMRNKKLPTQDSLKGFDEFKEFCAKNIDDASLRDELINIILQIEANTILENYCACKIRRADKNELELHKKLYYELKPILKSKKLIRNPYYLFELCPPLFIIIVYTYYKIIGRKI